MGEGQVRGEVDRTMHRTENSVGADEGWGEVRMGRGRKGGAGQTEVTQGGRGEGTGEGRKASRELGHRQVGRIRHPVGRWDGGRDCGKCCGWRGKGDLGMR